MSVPPNAREAWSQLTKMAQNAQRSGGPGGPRGVGAGVGGLLLLGGAVVLANNALFNVDGGHRAIKYTRIGGVKSEIFNEGQSRRSSETCSPLPINRFADYHETYRNSSQDPMV